MTNTDRQGGYENIDNLTLHLQVAEIGYRLGIHEQMSIDVR